MTSLKKFNYLQQATEKLRGIVQGISIDYKLTDNEILELQKWLKVYQDLHTKEPFLSMSNLLNNCLADQVVDENERDEILEWCAMFINESPFESTLKESTSRLQNVLQGITADGIVEKEELEELQDWLYDYEKYKNHWPFYETWNLIERILEDKKIDKKEQEEIIYFYRNFYR